MASRGQQINETTIKTTHTGAYAWEVEYGSNMTVICFAQGVLIQAHVSSVALRSANCTVTLYRRTTGGGWEQVQTVSASKSGKGTSSSDWKGDNAPMASTWYSRCCIFKVVISGSSAGSAYFRGRIKGVLLGTVCTQNAGYYNAYIKNNLIRCCNNNYWGMGGTYGDENSCLNACAPHVYRGNLITASNANRLVGSDAT